MTLAASAVLVGCGEGETPTRTTGQATATSTPEATPTTAAASRDAKVDMAGFAFVPARVTVPAGGEVTWTDRDKSNHTATFMDAEVDGIDNLRPGKSGSVTFRKRGTYEYVCEFHPGMAGTVEVQ